MEVSFVELVDIELPVLKLIHYEGFFAVDIFWLTSVAFDTTNRIISQIFPMSSGSIEVPVGKLITYFLRRSVSGKSSPAWGE